MIYVKTVYGIKSMRLPDVSKYSTEKEANSIIKMCLEWGIDIVSCGVINADEAKRLIASGAAETIGD